MCYANPPPQHFSDRHMTMTFDLKSQNGLQHSVRATQFAHSRCFHSRLGPYNIIYFIKCNSNYAFDLGPIVGLKIINQSGNNGKAYVICGIEVNVSTTVVGAKTRFLHLKRLHLAKAKYRWVLLYVRLSYSKQHYIVLNTHTHTHTHTHRHMISASYTNYSRLLLMCIIAVIITAAEATSCCSTFIYLKPKTNK